jgi:PAS domain S-box-containing protein
MSAGDRSRALTDLGNIADALDRLPLPTFAIAKNGIIRWLNRSAEAIAGDVRGERFLSVVAPESRGVVKEQFARKLLEGTGSSEYEAVLLRADGTPVRVEVSSVPFRDEDGMVAGVFGAVIVEPPDVQSVGRVAPHLTPRQAEVLMYLAHGLSTEQMAEMMKVSKETVRNHVRGLLQRLGVHSRLEAVTVGRARGLI